MSAKDKFSACYWDKEVELHSVWSSRSWPLVRGLSSESQKEFFEQLGLGARSKGMFSSRYSYDCGANYIRSFEEKEGERRYYWVVDAVHRQVVGFFSSYIPDSSDAPQVAAIGYRTFYPFRHQGWATKATALFCRSAIHTGIEQVVAETDRYNKGSRRTLLAAGFKFYGTGLCTTTPDYAGERIARFLCARTPTANWPLPELKL